MGLASRMASTAASIFFGFCQPLRVLAGDLQLGDFHEQLVVGRQELVQRRVDQADDHRKAVHGPEEALKVGALERQQLVKRFLALLGGFCLVWIRPGQDHLLDDRQAFGLEEHVLGAAEADALGAEAARPLGIPRVVGVCPDLQAAEAVRPGQELAQIGVAQVRYHGRDLPGKDLTGCAVDRDPVAFLVDLFADGHLLGLNVDVEGRHSDDSGFAELARHEGGVGGAAALAGQDAVGRQHAVDVCGAWSPGGP